MKLKKREENNPTFRQPGSEFPVGGMQDYPGRGFDFLCVYDIIMCGLLCPLMFDAAVGMTVTHGMECIWI